MSYNLTTLSSWELAAAKTYRSRPRPPALPSGLPALPTLSKIYRFAPTWTATYTAWGRRQRSRRVRRTIWLAGLATVLAVAATSWTFAPRPWRAATSGVVPAQAVSAAPPEQRRAVPAPAVKRAARASAATAPRAERPQPRGHELTAAQIISEVRSQAASLSPCLRQARRSGELVPGTHTLVLSWNITARGQVTGAELAGPPALMETSLRTCVPQQMRTWAFPPPSGMTPIERFPMRIRVP